METRLKAPPPRTAPSVSTRLALLLGCASPFAPNDDTQLFFVEFASDFDMWRKEI